MVTLIVDGLGQKPDTASMELLRKSVINSIEEGLLETSIEEYKEKLMIIELVREREQEDENR